MGLYKFIILFTFFSNLIYAQTNCSNDNVSLGNDFSTCVGSNVTLSATVTNVPNQSTNILNFSWNILGQGAISNANSSNYNFTLANTTSVTYVVTVNFINAYGCPDITDTIVISALQMLPGTIGGNLLICPGSDPPPFTNLTPASGGSNITYQWQSSTNSTTWNDIVGETSLTYDPGVIGNSIIYYRRIATVTFSGGNSCQVPSNVVNLQPVNGNINIQGSNPICVSLGSTNQLNTTFSSNPNNLTSSYSWSGPNGFTSTSLSPTLGSFTSNQIGTYTVTATISGTNSGTNFSCQVTDNITINLNPNIPTFSIPSTGCSGSTVNITGFTPQSGITYNWSATGNGISFSGQNTSNPTIIFGPNASGNYSVHVTAVSNSNGCSIPSASQIINVPNFGITQPFISLNGTYIVSQVINGVITFPICSGISTSNFLLENASLQNNQNPIGTTYTLTVGNGTPQPYTDSLLQNIIYGNNTFTLTANYNGCSKSLNFSVYSGSNPYVALGAQNSTGLCPGNSVIFTVDPIPNSGILNPPGTSYILTYSDALGFTNNFLDLTGDTSVSHQYSTTSCGVVSPTFPNNTYYATVTAQNPCGQSQSFYSPITVSSLPTANFNVSDSTICVGQTITVNNTGQSGSIVGSAAPYTCSTQGKFYWTISGGVSPTNYNIVSGVLGTSNSNWASTASNGSNTLVINFLTSGYYTISQIYYNSCGSQTKVRHICVINPPTCQFSISPISGCSPLAANINNTSTAPTCNGSPIIINNVWTISNPITGTTATISSNTNQNPTLNFTNTTNTVQTFTVSLNVIPMEPAMPTIPFSTSILNCSAPISSTGTVSLISGPVAGSWSATISGLASTNGVYVGAIISATPGTGSIGLNSTSTVTSVTANSITFSSSGGSAPTAGTVSTVICSITGTVGSISANGTSTWNATISGMCSTSGISVGSIIYATNGTGSIGSGGIYTVTAVTASSISYSATGGTIPVAGTLSNIYLQSCTSTCTQTVTVYPVVNFTNPSSATLCSGATLALNLTTNVSATYTWIAAPNANVTGESTFLQNGAVINDQLINLTNSVQTITYTVIATSISSLGSCTKTQTITITLNPSVSILTPADLILCPGIVQPSISYISNPPTGVTYTWTNSNNSIGLASSGNGVIPSFTPINNTNTNITASITINPFWGACPGTPQTFNITVKPMPTVTDPPDQIVCLGTPINAVVFSSPTNIIGTVYNWTNSNPSIGLAASGSGDISSFPTSVSGTATITATPSANGCTGLVQTFTILVKPIPVINTISNQVVCAGSNTSAITFTSSVANTTFNWVNSNPAIGLAASGASTTIPSFSATNTANTAIIGTITTTPTFNGCSGLPISFTITVNPRPTVDLIPNQILCNGLPTNAVQFTSTLNVSGTTYNWTNNNTSTGLASSGTGSIGQFTATNSSNANITSTITVTPTAGGCNGISSVFTIIVKPTPTVNIIPNQILCSGANSALVSPISTVTGSTFSWVNSNTTVGLAASGNGSIPIFIGQNTTNSLNIATITVTPTANGCIGVSSNFTLTIKPIPTVDALNNQIICNGTPSSAVIFSSLFGVTGTTFNWTNSNITIGLSNATGSGNISSFNAINNTTNPIISTISITPTANGCSGTPVTFTYTINPTPSVSAIINQVKCAGTLSNAVNYTSNPMVAGTQYNWTNSNANIGLGANGTGNIPAFTTINTGNSAIIANITVTPIANNCNGNSINFSITINPTPQVLNLSNITVCPQTVVPSNILTSNVTGATYVWNINNSTIGMTPTSGSTSNIPGFTALNNSTSPITATVTITPSILLNSVTCIGTPATYTITVNPKPTMTPFNPQLFVFCEASSAIVNFNSNITTNMSYAWTNDNIAIGIGASGTSSSPGAGISFTAVNNSNQPLTSNFIVTPSYTNNGVVCPSTPVSFAITINPLPDIIPLNSYTICATSTGSNLYSSLNPIIGLGTTYVWTNSNPAIGMISSGTGSNYFTATNSTQNPITGIISVTPTYTNNNVACTGNPITFNITVTPMPTVDPIANQSLCVGSTTNAVTLTGNIPNTVFSWNNGNTTTGLGLNGTATIPSFIGLNSINQPNVSTINVTPSYTFNNITCTGTAGQFGITVNPTPILDTIINYQICSGGNLNVAFTSATNIIGTFYQWTNSNTNIGLSSAGNGNLSFNATNTTNAPITAQITVTPAYTNAGITCTGNSRTFIITILPTPIISTLSNQNLCSGANTNPINFASNLSGTVFNWTNSNNSIGLVSNGTGSISSFIGTNSGTQPIQGIISVSPALTTNNQTCTGNPVTATITINPVPIMTAINSTSYCQGASVNLILNSNLSSNVVYNWTNSNNAIGLVSSGTGNINFTAINATSNSISSVISVTPVYTYNGISCTGSPMTFNIQIIPSPTVNPIIDLVVCNNTLTNPITFGSNALNTTFSWVNGNTTIGLAANGANSIPAFTATNSSTTSPLSSIVSVTPTLSNGGSTCIGQTINFNITVNPTTTVNTIPNITICNGANSSAINFSGTGNAFTWSNNNTSIGLGASGIGNVSSFTATNTVTSPISSTVSVLSQYIGGGITCSGNSTNFMITVNPNPTVNPTPNQTLCSGSTSNLISLSGNSTSYSWTNSLPSIGLANSGSGNIPIFTAINTTNNPVIATISITPVYQSGATSCNGLTQSFTITVNPAPVVNFSVGNQTICSNSLSSLVTISTSTSNALISWTTTNVPASITGLNASSGNNSIPAFTLGNSATTPQTITFLANATTSGSLSCPGGGVPYTITINPTPTLTAISNQVLCTGSTTTAVSFAGNATNYVWTNNSAGSIGLGASGSGNIPSFLTINNGNTVLTSTINVTPQFINNNITCNGTPLNFTITVNPNPIVNSISALTLCNTQSTLPIVITGTGTSYNWTNSNTQIGLGLNGSGNINPFVAQNSSNAPISASISVIPTFTNSGVSCPGTPLLFSITVNPTPTSNQVNNQVICNSASTSAILFTGTGTSYSWTNSQSGINLASSGNGNIPAFTAMNNGSLPLISTVTVTPIYTNNNVSCNGSTATFTITVNPTPNVNVTQSQVICNGTSTNQIVFSGSGTSYNWNNSNSTIGLNSSGTGTINSFTGINNSLIAVSGQISVTPIFLGNSVTCNGTPQLFSITVNPSPSVLDPLDQVICNGLPINAVNFSGNGSSYSWSNNTPSIGLAATGIGNITSFNAQNTTNSPVTATITVQPIFTGSSLNCPGIIQTFTITVNPTPTLNPLTNQIVCNGSSTNTILLSGNSTSYSWLNNTPNIGLSSSGTGNILSFTALNSSNSSPLIGTITVTPLFTNGGLTCNGINQQATITVNPTPIVATVPNVTLCNGSLSSVISFSGTGTSYSWSNNNTNIGLASTGIGNIASFTPTNSGIQPLTGSISIIPTYSGNGINCAGNNGVFNITINPTPTVNPIANQVICNGNPSISVGLSGSVPNTTYNWTNNTPSIGLTNSGTGTIPSFNGINNTSNPIIAQINATPVYTNNNVSCNGTAQNFSITVNPTPLVNFNLSNQTICSQNNNASVSISSPTAGAVISWSVVSIPPSISGFTTTSGGSSIPSLNLVNSSSSPQTIQLIANATTGGNLTCPGGGTPYTITVNPTPIVTDPADQVICHNLSTSLVIFSGTGTSYTWTNNTSSIGLSSSGQGNISTFSVINGTSSIVTATIVVTPQYSFNNITCPGTTQNFSITVNPIPVVNSISNSTFCNGTTSTSIAISGTGTSYSWTNSNPTIGLVSSGTGSISPFQTINTGATSINSTISITPTFLNAGVSCTGNNSNFTITVNPTPTINPLNSQVVCNNTLTSAVIFSGTGTSYTWINNNPTIGLQLNGTGNIIPFTATNSSTQNVVTSTITATPIYTNNSISCPGSTASFTLTVNPTPTVSTPSNQTVCNGLSTSNIVFSGTGTSYTWTNSAPSISLSANGTGSINAFVATNNTTSPINAQIAVTPLYLGNSVSCAGSTQNFLITVNPTPTLLDPADQVICNNTLSSGVNFSGNGTSYSWVNDKPSIGLAATGTGNILAFNSINTTLIPVVATISITPNFSGGATSCPGVGQSFTITVNPTPSLTPLTNQTLCSGNSTAAINFTGTGTSYTWTNNTPAINLLASGIGNIPSFTIANSSNSNVLVSTITATPVYSNAGLACQGNSQQMTFTVNPTPIVTPISNLTYCNAFNTQLISFAGTGTNYNWTNNNTTIGLNSSGSGTSISSFNTINLSTQTVVSNIIVTPQYLANGITCLGNDTNFSITINPTPTVDPIANQTVCNNAQTSLVVFNGAVPNTIFNWSNNTPSIGLSNAGSGNITAFNGLNNGTTPVIAQINVTPVFTTNNVSCPGALQSFTYTINPTPIVNNPGNQYACDGVNSNNLIFGGTGNSYSWISSNQTIGIPSNGINSIASFLTQNSSNIPISSSITVTPYFNAPPVSCPGTVQTFTYFVLPNPIVNPIANQNYCHQSSVPASTIAGTGTSYTWNNSNTTIGLGSSGINTINSFNAVNASAVANISTISITPTYSYQGTTCNGLNSNYTITINPLPHVNLINDTVICNYESLATNISSNIPANFTWSAAPNNNVNGELTTTQTSNFIIDSLSNLSNSPQFVTYTITPTSLGCVGPDSSFTAQVQPNVVLTNPTNIEICSGAPVNALLNANIPSNFQWFVSINNPNVTGESILTNSTNIINDVLINNTTTNQVVVYSVFPTSILGNCFTAAQTITVIVKPPLSLLNNTTLTICSNDNVNLNLVSNTNVTFNWYADQSLNVLNETTSITTSSIINDVLVNISPNVEVVNYHVIGTSSVNGCSSPIIPITVYVNPVPVVDPTLDLNLCNNINNPPITFTGNVPGAIYNWTSTSVAVGLSSSNGINSISGFNTTNLSSLPISAVINVNPTFTNNNVSCTGTVDQFTITVNPEPSIYLLPNIVLCNGVISNTIPVAGPINGTVYSWTNSNPAIGLGASGIGDIPSFFGNNLTTSTIQSTIEVTPSFINNTTTCYGQITTVNVMIHPMPHVLNNDIAICSGENTNIVLQSDISSSFQWHADPITNVYNETSYPLQTSSFIVDNLVQTGSVQEVVQYHIVPISIPFGCIGPDSIILVYVNPIPIVNFSSINPPYCDLNPISFSNNSVGILDYTWSFGDGLISYLNNPIHQFPSVGTFNIQLNATNPLTGCTDSIMHPIVISPSPNANFSYSDSLGCDLLDVIYTPLSFNPTWDYLWNFGNGATTLQAGPVGYQFDAPGCYDVSLTVTNNQGCSSTESYSNIACVYDSPIASFNADQITINVIEPLVHFNNESQNTSSYEWNFGDGTNGFAENPIHAFPGVAGDYTVILTAFNQIGCVDTAAINIHIFEDLIIYVPNSFTPNGDEKNQEFLPVITAGYKKGSYVMYIYDRWGELIFETYNLEIGWNGTYGESGHNCQTGVYTWVVEFELLQNQEIKQFVGHVNLIK